jgi:hypothetical protein
VVVYKTWVDFIICPGEAQRIQTHEQRLDTRNVIDFENIDPNDHKAMGLAVELARKQCALAPKNIIFNENDPFEAMEIDDYGNVTIWTKNKVWEVRRLYGFSPEGYEKLFFTRRHPPE